MRALLLSLLAASAAMAGCVSAPADDVVVEPSAYLPVDPDMNLVLEEFDLFLPGADVEIHARIVKPAGDGPFPVIAQFTPYTAPGQNTLVDALAEPVLGNNNGRFDLEFVRRGYAFAYADVRGTGDSTGCLDLRGQADIDDLWHLTEALGTAPWSSGKVGFIGASYPGSEAHMAALAGNEHLAAVVPIVASTSFYHYHHNDGVPYNGQHSIGGTNTGYTQNALMPTLNPQSPNYVPRYLAEATGCTYHENMVNHGGLDQSGAYYDWWQERNLRPRASDVAVPVLMAQGLADWNVKPDHIATWYNDLNVQKTLIAGQWGHAYPSSDDTPYGNWWQYVTIFFDTHVKGINTGMFQEDTAWVQANDDSWHKSAAWPLASEDLVFHITPEGLAPTPSDGRYTWFGCPDDQYNKGQFALAIAESATLRCPYIPNQAIAFETAPFEQDTYISGVPVVEMSLRTEQDRIHIVTLLERIGSDGAVVEARENYGYLNPIYRNGLEDPQDLPDTLFRVAVDMYPQEDLVEAGQYLRLTIRSDDSGRTIEEFDMGEIDLEVSADHPATLTLPTRPASLQGI